MSDRWLEYLKKKNEKHPQTIGNLSSDAEIGPTSTGGDPWLDYVRINKIREGPPKVEEPSEFSKNLDKFKDNSAEILKKAAQMALDAKRKSMLEQHGIGDNFEQSQPKVYQRATKPEPPEQTVPLRNTKEVRDFLKANPDWQYSKYGSYVENETSTRSYQKVIEDERAKQLPQRDLGLEVEGYTWGKTTGKEKEYPRDRIIKEPTFDNTYGDRIKLKYHIGDLTDNEGLAWSHAMDSGDSRQAVAISKKIEKVITEHPWIMQDPDFKEWYGPILNFTGSGLEATAEMLPTMLNSAKEGFKTAIPSAVGAMGVAAMVGQAGPQIAAPEEAITVPAAGLMGLKVGYGLGAAEHMFHVERGLSYKTMMQKQVDPEVAKTWSTVVGVANAGIELVQLGTLLKSVKGLGSAIVHAGELPLGQFLTTVGKKHLAKLVVGVAKETSQEVAQEMVSIGGETAADMQMGREVDLWSKENTDRLLQTAIQSAKAFVVLQGSGQVMGATYRAAFKESKNDTIKAINQLNNPQTQESLLIDISPLEEFEETIRTISEQSDDPFFGDALGKIENIKMKLTDRQSVPGLRSQGEQGTIENAVEPVKVAEVVETKPVVKAPKEQKKKKEAVVVPQEVKPQEVKAQATKPVESVKPGYKVGDKFETVKDGIVTVSDVSDSALIKFKNANNVEFSVGRKALNKVLINDPNAIVEEQKVAPKPIQQITDAHKSAGMLTQDEIDELLANEPKTEVAATTPRRFQRYEEEGKTTSIDDAVNKPQGLYLSDASIKSPHADLGGPRTEFEFNPDANVLKLDVDMFETNRGFVGESAGIGAARKFLGDTEVSRLLKLHKSFLIKELSKKYPDIQWDRYYDQQEMLEGVGGILARQNGYDAIDSVDVRGNNKGKEDLKLFDEFVALTKNAIRIPAEKKAELKPVEEKKAEPKPVEEKKAEPKPVEEKAETTQDTKGFDLKRAISAHNWVSHNPEGIAGRMMQEYLSAIDSYTEMVNKFAKNDAQKAIVPELIQTFTEKLLKRYNDLLSATSRTASPMVTGPAKFPTARNNKALASEQNKRTALIDFINSAEGYAKKQMARLTTNAEVNEIALKAIEKEVKYYLGVLHDIKYNNDSGDPNLFRSNFHGKLERIAKNGDLATVKHALEYIKANQDPKNKLFADRNNVWDLATVAQVQKEKMQISDNAEDTVIQTYEGAKLISSPADDRVKIAFDSKPTPEIMVLLKKSGWNWSGKNKAWQRKLTPQAIASAKTILKSFKTIETQEVEVVESDNVVITEEQAQQIDVPDTVEFDDITSPEAIEKTDEAIEKAEKAEEIKEAEPTEPVEDDSIKYPGLKAEQVSFLQRAYPYKQRAKSTFTTLKSLMGVAAKKEKRSPFHMSSQNVDGGYYWIVKKEYITKGMATEFAKHETKPISDQMEHSLMDEKDYRDRLSLTPTAIVDDTVIFVSEKGSVHRVDIAFYDYFSKQNLTFVVHGTRDIDTFSLMDENGDKVGVVLPYKTDDQVIDAKYYETLPDKIIEELPENVQEVDLKGFKNESYETKGADKSGNLIQIPRKGITFGGFAITDKQIFHLESGMLITEASRVESAKFIVKYFVYKLGENPTLTAIKEFYMIPEERDFIGELKFYTFDQVKERNLSNDIIEKSYEGFKLWTSQGTKKHRHQGGIMLDIFRAADSAENDHGPVPMNKPYKFPEEIETIRLASVLKKKSALTKIKETLTEFKHITTRTYRDLSENDERNAIAFKVATSYKNLNHRVSYMAISMLENIVSFKGSKLTKEEFNRFERYILLRDLAEDVELGIAIPQHYQGKVTELLANLEQSLNKNILDAVERRDFMLERLKVELIDVSAEVGVDLSETFGRKNYFRHMVIEYQNTLNEFNTAKSMQVNKNRGYYKQREGTDKLIVEEYIVAEYSVLKGMLHDIEVAKMWIELRDSYDITKKLKSQAKKMNQNKIESMAMDEIFEIIKSDSEFAEGAEKFIGKGFKDTDFKNLKKMGITSPIQLKLSGFNQKMAMGFSYLQKMAANDQLPMGDRYQWEKAVNVIESGKVDKTGEAKVMAYLAYLSKLEDGTTGKVQALTILNAIAKREVFYKTTLGLSYMQHKQWVDPRLIPDDYTTTQPIEGKQYFMANTISEEFATALLSTAIGDFGPLTELKQSQLAVRKLLAIGADRMTFVMPKSVVSTIESIYHEIDRQDSAIKKLFAGTSNLWKRWMLQWNPLRIFKYQFRNITGDVDALMGAAGSKVAIYVPRAAMELKKFIYDKDGFSPTLLDFYNRGGFEANIFVQEVAAVKDINEFKKLSSRKDVPIVRVGKALSSPVRVPLRIYGQATKDLSIYRESILRYAAYLYYLAELQKNNGKLDYYGASSRAMITGLVSNKDKAYQLSNDALGAYNQITEFGGFLRKYIRPFHSWTEIEFKRYYRMVKNAVTNRPLMSAIGQDYVNKKFSVKDRVLLGAKGVFLIGKIIFRVAAFTSLLIAYNRKRQREADDMLPDDIKNTPHITFGIDKESGEVIYFSRVGALNDLLAWFGLDTIEQDISDLKLGRKTLAEQAEDMTWAPLNQFISGLHPFIKSPLELLTGKSIYPDARLPRTIRDDGYYIAQTFGVGTLYAMWQEIPMSKSKANLILDAMAYRSSPEMNAYYKILDLKNAFSQSVLFKPNTSFTTDDPKSKALYYMKLAMKYGDKDLTKKYFLDYVQMKGTSEGLKRGLESMNPLYGLDQIETIQFFAYLTYKERKELVTAMKFYYESISLEGK